MAPSIQSNNEQNILYFGFSCFPECCYSATLKLCIDFADFIVFFVERQHSSMLCRCPVIAIVRASVCPSIRHTLLPIKTMQSTITKSAQFRIYQRTQRKQCKNWHRRCVVASASFVAFVLRCFAFFYLCDIFVRFHPILLFWLKHTKNLKQAHVHSLSWISFNMFVLYFVKNHGNKKSELILIKRARAYSSFCFYVVSVYLHSFHLSSMFVPIHNRFHTKRANSGKITTF